MSHVNYNIVFDNGKVAYLKYEPCFSALGDLRSAVEWHDALENLGIDLTTTDVKKIFYKPRIDSSLSEADIIFYLEYLYYHRGWGRWVLNDSFHSIRNDGVFVRADISGTLILATLTAYRYLDEVPKMVKNFRLFSSKMGLNQDLAFFLAHIFENMSDFVMESPLGWGGHSLIYAGRSTLEDIGEYVTSFPYVDKIEKYNSTYSVSGVCEHFNRVKKDDGHLSIFEAIKSLRKDRHQRIYDIGKVASFIKDLQQRIKEV